MQQPNNFGVVVPQKLYRGAQPTAAHVSFLHSLGVDTIVSLRGADTDVADLEDPSFRLIPIPCELIPPPSASAVMQFLQVALGPKLVAGDPAPRPVFVHCQQGKDRTGMMVAAYRMVVEGWTVKQALAEMDRYGFHTWCIDITAAVRRLPVADLRQRLGLPAMQGHSKP